MELVIASVALLLVLLVKLLGLKLHGVDVVLSWRGVAYHERYETATLRDEFCDYRRKRRRRRRKLFQFGPSW